MAADKMLDKMTFITAQLSESPLMPGLLLDSNSTLPHPVRFTTN